MAIKIFISGPYTAETEEDVEDNVNSAISAAMPLMDAGFIVFVPHTYKYFPERPWEYWMKQCIGHLQSCNILYVIGLSKGTAEEIKHAIENNIPIEYSAEDIIRKYGDNNELV